MTKDSHCNITKTRRASRRSAGLFLCAGILWLTPPPGAYGGGYGFKERETRTEAAGDILQLAIPAAGLLTSLVYEDDWTGSYQFAKTIVVSQMATEGLKLVVDKRRPNGRSSNSFPSGHSSAAFAGASFIQRRYGWLYAIPAYAGAGYVAYSRVYADKHYVEDVIAGAVIGTLSSYWLVDRYSSFEIVVMIGTNHLGFGLTSAW
jgi:hypothetical protein